VLQIVKTLRGRDVQREIASPVGHLMGLVVEEGHP
jgi:hypothetical protein